MKKIKLFLAAFAAMVGLSASAQLTEGTVYWIQDTGTGQFISQGADWGTQATVKNVSGLGFEVAYVSDGVYKLKNVMWNKMNSAERGLGSGRYVDSGTGNGTSTIAEVTLTASGDGYKLSIDGNYLTNNGSAKDYSGTKVLGSTTDASLATVWKFLTKAEYDAALSTIKNNRAAELATIVGLDGITSFSALETELAGTDYVSVDQTSKITNAALNAGNIDGWTGTAPNQRSLAFGSENGTCAESWNGVAWARQTISNLPNGLYKVTFVGTFRPGTSANAETLTSEQTSSPAYVYANNDCEEFIHWIDVSTKANNRSGVVNNASNYTSTFYTYVSNGTIELGVVQDAFYNSQTWCPFGHFTLTQIYSVASYRKAYNDAMTAATAAQTSLTGFSAYASKKTTLDNAITSNTLTGDDLSDIDKLQASADALNAAAAAVAKEKAACDQYATIVSTIGESTNVDLTSFVSNPGFETGDLTGWTSEDGGNVANNNNFSGKGGSYYAERWQLNTALEDGSLTHDGIVLPAGVYSISANAQNIEQYNSNASGTGLSLVANDASVAIGAAGVYSTYVKINSDKDELVISFVQDDCTGNWISYDNIQLTYVGSDFPAYTLVTGKMSSAASTAQSSAETTYVGAQTVTNYNALIAAINAAQASKDAYAKTAQAITDARTLGTNFNFATAAATSTFTTAVDAVESAYNDNTLSDASAANAGNLGTVLVGWHAVRASENYTIAEAYMKSAWTDGELNDWSTEGDSDGSNFHVPFFQNWIADANSLAEGTTSGQLTGLENGLYEVSAWVRVRIKDGQEAGTVPSGITLAVNNGTAVDACAGTQIGETQFYLATITAEGLVKDGTLNAVFTRSAENNISWLSFKNVKYTKVRDLTPEEAAVVPADLAIDATSTVFKGKTATLTATSTTEGASIDGFVNWTSDNTSVATVDANGVVTGVAYGTANITATSSLNAAATATCAVTVTAPTYDQLENLDFAGGPVIDNHICTYSADMTKSENNTTFCHVQEVAGWSIASTDVDGKAAGVMAYGSSTGMGNNSIFAPATNPDAEATGNVLGMVGVWTNSVQYVQNVKLPAGAYTITIPVYRNGGATALTKNLIGVILDDGTEHLATTTTYAQDTWTTETIKFTVTEDTYGKLSLGLDAPNKGSNDSQRLWIDGVTVTFEPFATTEEIAALNAAITTAEGYALGFDKDDYAPYKNVAAVTALATAKALDTTNPIAQSDVTSATTALTSATWTANTEEVNAVYDGTFAAAENNGAPAGWTMSNNTLGGSYHARAFVGDERLSEFNSTNSGFYLRFDGTNSNRGSMYYYGNTAGYTVPLKEGVTYYVKVDVAGWGSTGKPIRMNVTGPEGFTSVGDQVNTSVQADNSSDAPQQIFFTFTASVAGNYVINFQTPGADTNTHAVVISNLELKRVLEISEEDTSAPTAVDYANVTLTRTLKGGQWNGFSVPFGFTIAGSALEGAKVKEFASVADNEIALQDATTIVAGNPYLVKPASDVMNPTFEGVAVTNPEEAVKGEGDYTFQAHLYNTALDTDGSVAYVSTTDSSIKKLTSGSIKGLRAIFNIPVSSNPKALVVRFDNTPTGILSVDAEGNVYEGAIYNLAGQKLNAPVKGINIIGGKKVVVK